MAGVSKPTEDNGGTRFLSEDELDRLLTACRESKSPDLLSAVMLSITSGGRQAVGRSVSRARTGPLGVIDDPAHHEVTPLPTLRVARLAVAETTQGRGVGQALLRSALTLARRMADEIGCVGVVVDAKPEAQAFYRRYGFESVSAVEGVLLDRPEPLPMFLPLSAIPCPDKQ
jgi:ribosomal protein S18 acetylase RimI-like enzyme